MAQLRMSEWESSYGWSCGDVSSLAKGTSKWEHQPRIWQMAPAQWLKMIIEQYHAKVDMFDNNMILFYWDKQSDMRKYKNATAAMARKIGYEI